MKTRLFFVSNSSSSSFIVKTKPNGSFETNGYDCVYATVGLGFTAERVKAKSEDDVVDYFDTENFKIEIDYESSEIAFIRSFAKMQQEQTLAEFTEETVRMFSAIVGGYKLVNIQGPHLLAAGSVGCG
jgi:hypothetical protein